MELQELAPTANPNQLCNVLFNNGASLHLCYKDKGGQQRIKKCAGLPRVYPGFLFICWNFYFRLLFYFFYHRFIQWLVIVKQRKISPCHNISTKSLAGTISIPSSVTLFFCSRQIQFSLFHDTPYRVIPKLYFSISCYLGVSIRHFSTFHCIPRFSK